jgi:hypothetical protein
LTAGVWSAALCGAATIVEKEGADAQPPKPQATTSKASRTVSDAAVLRCFIALSLT